VASDIRWSKISVCEKAIDWDHAMVLVSGQSGRPTAGVNLVDQQHVQSHLEIFGPANNSLADFRRAA
jgi:hypothetical protein